MKNRAFGILAMILLGYGVCISGSVAIASLNDGLLAYYPFSGNANDASGNGRDGTVHGALTLTADRLGKPNSAYYFNNYDQYISIPHPFGPTVAEFSFSAWVFSKISNSFEHFIIYKGAYQGQCKLSITGNGNFQFGVNLSDDGWHDANYPFQPNQWYHIVGNYVKGNRLELWINGILQAQEPITNSNLFSNSSYTSPSTIGSYSDTGNYSWYGTIDDVRIYNRVLSNAEIQQLYLGAPAIGVNPISLSASCQPGQNAASQTIEVWNSDVGTLTYTISDNAAWLSCTPASGTSTGEHDTITVNYDTAGLPIGNYNATITITDSGASNSPQTIPVTLKVYPIGPAQWTGSGANNHWYEAISVPEGITWTAAKAAAEARGGYLATATSAAENGFIFSLINDWNFWWNYNDTSGQQSAGPWLGGYYVGASGTMNPNDWAWVSGEPWGYTNWLAGEPNYTNEKVILFYGNGNNNMQPTWNNFPDNLTPKGYVVEWNSSIVVNPISLSPSCQLKENAASQTFEVWNLNSGTLNYTISDNAAWLSCTPASGTSTGEHDTITVNYDTAGLVAGTYNATIIITDSGGSTLPQTIPVSLKVAQSGVVQWKGPGANNHWYQAVSVPEGITWTAAKAAAEARGGYLATVTSAAENNFIFSLINDWKFWGTDGLCAWGPWLGGYYIGIPGTMNPDDWAWVTGEPWGYQNWCAEEPNFSYETVMHFWGIGSNMQPTWNNLASNNSPSPKGYVVEWNNPTMTPIMHLLLD